MAWPRPTVFAEVADIGKIAEAEMFTTFNMGIGFVAVVSAADVTGAQESLGIASHVIGTVIAGSGLVHLG